MSTKVRLPSLGGYQRYILNRLFSTAIVLIVLSLLTFFMIRLIPGDPLAGYYDTQGVPSQTMIDNLRADLGLNEAWYVQYFSWMAGIFVGDFGSSLTSPFDVTDQIARRLPFSIQLAVMGTALAIVIGIPLGTLAGSKQGSLRDGLVRAPTFAVLGLPEFLIALAVVLINSVTVQWPMIGGVSPLEEPLESLRRILVPALIVALPLAALIVRYLRAGIIDDLDRPYILTLRAKGLNTSRIVTRHALRNSLIPVTTVVGVGLANLIGGTIVIENVFAIPGMGQLLIQSISQSDYPTIQGAVLVIGTVYLLLNLVVDLTYPFIDPRVGG